MDHPQPDPKSAVHTFCHAIPDQHYQMGVMLAATDSLNWLADILLSDPAELTSELPKNCSRRATLISAVFVWRTDTSQLCLAARFMAWTIQPTTRTQMIHSVIEGVSFALKENLDAWNLVASSWIRCGPSVAGLNQIIGCRYWQPSWIVPYGG